MKYKNRPGSFVSLNRLLDGTGGHAADGIFFIDPVGLGARGLVVGLGIGVAGIGLIAAVGA